MIYERITNGIFISRPNRFIANIELDGKLEACHVKNTGRCRELLVPGAAVYVQKSNTSGRKTAYDLISVRKGSRLINMDSQIPNKVFKEWAEYGGVKNLTYIKGEQKYGNSRLDFYMEADNRKIFAEIKGVTLEENGAVLFPDAPTERGVKHVNELCKCIYDGFEPWIVFIIQMNNVKYFTPNDKTHPEFGTALRNAKNKGVKILALECNVTENSITATGEVPVKL